ncbi:Fic family protein [Rhizosphaericola mali]|uniref:Filamentation induced by cAMP protein Fic-like C-terminal domain-containing protein n=1 Tax=Rhizosphaericola mali TaxID=2545455 RepID=A0A5P2G1E8_9BACT|nr:ATP-binding protein [Rhizosphaericola mali]QES88508.1 hypothetical protein E0W69_007485 [Rhizosphaericola mali]
MENHIQINSYSCTPSGLSQEEFFEGFSVPRNKELMRIFKDLDLVEQLGSGVPRILQAYSKENFQFSENFLRLTLPASEEIAPQDTPQDTQQDTPQDTPQVEELLKVMDGQHSRQELQDLLKLADRENFRLNYLQPAINAGYIALTLPDKPTSRNQRYYLTQKGKNRIK